MTSEQEGESRMVTEALPPESNPSPNCWLAGETIPATAVIISPVVSALIDDEQAETTPKLWRPTERIPRSQRWFPCGQ